jgi:hypothetical protein
MIIDCCKMTPVQSQCCMFSMIISSHFSHSEMKWRCKPTPVKKNQVSLHFSHSDNMQY